jgi:hypothetical protein
VQRIWIFSFVYVFTICQRWRVVPAVPQWCGVHAQRQGAAELCTRTDKMGDLQPYTLAATSPISNQVHHTPNANCSMNLSGGLLGLYGLCYVTVRGILDSVVWEMWMLQTLILVCGVFHWLHCICGYCIFHGNFTMIAHFAPLFSIRV